jgi:uncharacterized protein YbjT (DUF2867 family)
VNSDPTNTVLILGADGFIGRHLAYHLRHAGWHVIASARHTDPLTQMGFETLEADLTDPMTHDPVFWEAQIHTITHLVNATAATANKETTAGAIHQHAPSALYQAMPQGTRGLLVSAVDIDTSDSGFARQHRAAETLATAHGLTILRTGLVLGDTTCGGSSLIRALAACPLATPMIGAGEQRYNPIHVDDLSAVIKDCLETHLGPGLHVTGGAAIVTQAELLGATRRWLGLTPVRSLSLPAPLARILGALGVFMNLGPLSRDTVERLSNDLLADPTHLNERIKTRPLGFKDFHAYRPAGTQDLWHARLTLMRPMLRVTLAFLWLVSGLVSLTLPASQFLPQLQSSGLPDIILDAATRLGGLAGLVIAYALVRGRNLRKLAIVQFGLIAFFTLTLGAMVPALWTLPLGGLLKNLPLLVLIGIHAILEDKQQTGQ